MELLQLFKAFALLLLITTYCQSAPVEFITGEADETATTICPEELAKRKLENFNIRFDEEVDFQKENLPSKVENENNLGKIPTTTDVSDETTTICPEELERRKLEGNSIENSQKIEDSEQEVKESASQSHTENPEETTTIGLEKLEKRKLQQVEENVKEISEKTIDHLEDERFQTVEVDDDLEASKETMTLCSEEIEKGKEQNNKNLNEIIDNTETFKDSTTLCPKELARRKLEQSQKYLTKFKELVDKAQQGKPSRRKRQVADYSYYVNQPAYNSQGVAVPGTNANSNQQQISYSPQGYSTLQGQTASSTSQQQQSYKPQAYKSQTYSPQAVKTYQQIQKQFQTSNNFQKNPNLYRKTFQNNVKPVNSYRNPSTYVRYPSNGSFKNNYRLNQVGNRRQFQGARPLASTSARPNIRVTRKKKFKPSPVFA